MTTGLAVKDQELQPKAPQSFRSKAARAASAPPAAPTALAFSFPSLSLTLSGRFLVWAHRGRRFVFRTSAHQRGPPGSPVPLSSRTFPDELRPLHQGTHLLAETCPTSSPGAFPSSSHHTQPAPAFSFTRVGPTPVTPTPGWEQRDPHAHTHTQVCTCTTAEGWSGMILAAQLIN